MSVRQLKQMVKCLTELLLYLTCAGQCSNSDSPTVLCFFRKVVSCRLSHSVLSICPRDTRNVKETYSLIFELFTVWALSLSFCSSSPACAIVAFSAQVYDFPVLVSRRLWWVAKRDKFCCIRIKFVFLTPPTQSFKLCAQKEGQIT